MEFKSFKDLQVWQKAKQVGLEVYKLTKELPKEELYGLTSQMRRAAVSIPSNISEGHARKSTKEFINFLSIALGSTAELETQLIFCVELGYLNQEQTKEACQLLDEIGKMIRGLNKKLVSSL